MTTTSSDPDARPVNSVMPSTGRDHDEIIAELTGIARAEDSVWEGGGCSGTIYCGDRDHYGFMAEAFELFAHVNALQRDMCPSVTRFEGEIIAMTIDMLHAGAVDGTEPAGMVTSGGSSSILHAVLAYREQGRDRDGKHRPNIVKPETGHPAFDKAGHLLGVEVRRAPIDPETTHADVEAMAGLIDDQTIAIVGSAPNYGYGTIDPIDELGALALDRGVGLHVDGCLGGFILPWGEVLGYDLPTWDFRVPGVTTISADTHKYGYGFKGTSVLAFADKTLRNGQYFYLTDWTGGKYCSPGIDGSRSGGLLAATWAAMVSLGREGYVEHARGIFETSFAMQDVVRSHPALRIMGDPSFCFSFTSDEFDIYHVNDVLKSRGWRLNGQQYPDAVHMAVTRPQVQPGVVERFADDLAEAVLHAESGPSAPPATGAIYGGVAGGLTAEADEFIRAVMADYMDAHQSVS
ncbi:pyridoxal phosphate-dependent decarboxylase family protein [Ilumatobacter sp.]|uniref:pyridoxal phosphate-dependent decarboxylase family protein n=1 Tax=Ilumatobacter sp. TaxID=1967498 RepID=UPI003AF58B7E